MTTTVTYPSPDGTIDAALARPKGEGPWPAVILWTDIWGLRDVFRDMAERLAANGYAVLVPNVYYRLPPAEQPNKRGDFGQPGMRETMFALKDSLTRDRVGDDARAALAFLDAQPFVSGAKIGVAGYCMGGPIAMWTAAALGDGVAAAASFHGAGLATDHPDSPHRLAAAYAAELYFGNADNDPFLPPEQVATLEAALRASNVRFTSELYEGAPHGYAVADGPAYDEAAAERHWAALTGLLKRTL